MAGALLFSPVPSEKVVACVGLVSDTHMPERCAAFPASTFEVLRGVDIILHAGDVGELWVLDHLSAIAPVVAVHGNDDTRAAQRELPYQQLVSIAEQRVLLWHSHYPDPAEDRARRGAPWHAILSRLAARGRGKGRRFRTRPRSDGLSIRRRPAGKPRGPGFRQSLYPPDTPDGGAAVRLRRWDAGRRPRRSCCP